MQAFVKSLVTFLLIGLVPVSALLSLYFYFDPFKVLRCYDDYSYPYVIPNRDYVSTTMFIKNYETRKYNSFILGSSRTLAFRPSSWQKHLSNDDTPYMFDASAESIYGIYTKLRYLDLKSVKIDNALIVLCRDVSFANSVNHKGHLFIKHPEISGESKIKFHYQFFKAYIDPMFIFSYHTYENNRDLKPFMVGFIDSRKITYDTISNEINIIDQEVEITESPTKYYAKRKEIFYERSAEQIDSVQRINTEHQFMIKEIRRILEKNNACYKVVLSPLYEQIKFHPIDLSILKKEFGNHLYDFSGKNSFTDNMKNYYESSHFRPHVGDSILKMIY